MIWQKIRNSEAKSEIVGIYLLIKFGLNNIHVFQTRRSATNT